MTAPSEPAELGEPGEAQAPAGAAAPATSAAAVAGAAAAAGRVARRLPPLLRERAFRRYWSAQTVSMLGDQVGRGAAPPGPRPPAPAADRQAPGA
ncbi:MAG TPA: hypothetical protein VGM79_17220 [Streptosporangiaceae bacterium]